MNVFAHSSGSDKNEVVAGSLTLVVLVVSAEPGLNCGDCFLLHMTQCTIRWVKGQMNLMNEPFCFCFQIKTSFTSVRSTELWRAKCWSPTTDSTSGALMLWVLSNSVRHLERGREKSRPSAILELIGLYNISNNFRHVSLWALQLWSVGTNAHILSGGFPHSAFALRAAVSLSFCLR